MSWGVGGVTGGRSCGLRKWVRGDVGGGLGGNVVLPLLEPQIFQYRYRYLRILLVAVSWSFVLHVASSTRNE